jgi:hypothetical protein
MPYKLPACPFGKKIIAANWFMRATGPLLFSDAAIRTIFQMLLQFSGGYKRHFLKICIC